MGGTVERIIVKKYVVNRKPPYQTTV